MIYLSYHYRHGGISYSYNVDALLYIECGIGYLLFFANKLSNTIENRYIYKRALFYNNFTFVCVNATNNNIFKSICFIFYNKMAGVRQCLIYGSYNNIRSSYLNGFYYAITYRSNFCIGRFPSNALVSGCSR